MAQTKNCTQAVMILLHRNFVQDHCTIYTLSQSMDEVWARLDQGERKYAPDKWCQMNVDKPADHHRAP